MLMVHAPFHGRGCVGLVTASRLGSRLSVVEHFSVLRWTHSSASARSHALGGANYNDAERTPEQAVVAADSQPVQTSRTEWRREGGGHASCRCCWGDAGRPKKATVSASPVFRVLQVQLTRIQWRRNETVRQEHRFLLSLMRVLQSTRLQTEASESVNVPLRGTLPALKRGPPEGGCGIGDESTNAGPRSWASAGNACRGVALPRWLPGERLKGA